MCRIWRCEWHLINYWWCHQSTCDLISFSYQLISRYYIWYDSRYYIWYDSVGKIPAIFFSTLALLFYARATRKWPVCLFPVVCSNMFSTFSTREYKQFPWEKTSTFFSLFSSNFRLLRSSLYCCLLNHFPSIQFSLFDITRVAKWNQILSIETQKRYFLKGNTCVPKCRCYRI